MTKELAPTLLRWGGCFCSYYRWKEGVGPRNRRPPMVNLLGGGIDNNQVGTHEFVDFCRRTGADPLIVVNFEAFRYGYYENDSAERREIPTQGRYQRWLVSFQTYGVVARNPRANIGMIHGLPG